MKVVVYSNTVMAGRQKLPPVAQISTNKPTDKISPAQSVESSYVIKRSNVIRETPPYGETFEHWTGLEQ